MNTDTLPESVRDMLNTHDVWHFKGDEIALCTSHVIEEHNADPSVQSGKALPAVTFTVARRAFDESAVKVGLIEEGVSAFSPTQDPCKACEDDATPVLVALLDLNPVEAVAGFLAVDVDVITGAVEEWRTDHRINNPQPGDLCRILDGERVQHYACDEHSDGTITDVRTGRVVES